MAQFGRNAIELKSLAEIATMRRGGHLLQKVILEVAGTVEPGITTLELDRLARSRIVEAGAKPAFLGMYGFPKTLCISINEEVVHGIPSKRKLKEGDIVSIDCGVWMDGFFSDTAYTVGVGKCSERTGSLMKATREALDLAIEQCHPGHRLGDIGHAVESHIKAYGFHVIRDYTGHGIGRKLHEDPKIENYGQPGTGDRLKAGMVLAIEPMIGIGTGETRLLDDKWTVITRDRSPAAHYEHTVAILEDGPEILTQAD